MESSKFENKIQEIRKNCVRKQRFCPKCGSLLYNPYSKDALYVKLLQNFGYANFDEPLLITLTPNDILSTLIENKINN